MLKPLSRTLYLLLLLTWVGVFASSFYYIKAAPGYTPTPPAASIPVASVELPATPVPPVVPTTLAILPDASEAGWSLLHPGLERRLLRIYDTQNQPVETLYVWRLDQKYFRLDVAFDSSPKTLERWQLETNAAIVMNGGYFSIENEQYYPDGLTVIDGVTSGRSFVGYGGMLTIDQSGAALRWLEQKPYLPGEQFEEALQSFPVLVKPGGQLGFGPEREDHKKARRTAIGQDREGRILFLIAPEGYFTLHELSAYLTQSDLNLDIVVNLDGGGSTGILVANPRELIPAKPLLPFVILAYPR